MERLRWSHLEHGVLAVLTIVACGEIFTGGYVRPLAGVGTYVAAVAAVMLARRQALVAGSLAALIYALTPLTGFDVANVVAWIPLLVLAFFLTGVHAPPARWPLGLASAAAGLALMYAGLAWLTDFDPSAFFGAAMTFGPWALGLALRRALDRETRFGADAERARFEAGHARARAVTRERERVADELHDVLAHALGAMVVQASMAGDAIRARADEAARILLGVAEAGRNALGETAALVRALREDAAPVATAATPPVAESRVTPADALLPTLFAVVATVEIVTHDYGPAAVGLASYGLACLALVARRAVPLVLPLLVTGLVVGAGLLGFDSDAMAASLPIGGLAFFAAGRYAQRASAGIAAASAGAAILVLDVARRDSLSADVLLFLVFAFGPCAIGVALRAAFARARAHAAETERAHLEAVGDAERAAAAERRRIARDLHDLLASTLSVMTVQASLGAELARADPARAEGAVEEVERAGRAALERTGELLRLIRDGDLGSPQHGAAELPALIAEFERAGLAVELEGAGLEPVPAGVGASLYRIVQEALTNALKHAPGSRVRIRVSRGASDVEVEVLNTPPADERRVPVEGGHGLIGLRERVALYGGRLDARRTPDGGFVLAASVPLAGER